VAQDVFPDTEEVAALLGEHAVQELGRVLAVGPLVPHDETALDFAQLHFTLEHVQVFHDVTNSKFLLVNVCSVSTTCIIKFKIREVVEAVSLIK
jgi:hypothetical protein